MHNQIKPFPKRIGRGCAVDDEQRFKDQFAVTFLATWAANNYEAACMNGQHRRIEHPPVEDAQFLAGKAWEEWVARNH